MSYRKYLMTDDVPPSELYKTVKIGTDSDTISRADVEQTVEDNILCYTHSDRPIDQDPDTECHMAIRTALRMLRKDLGKLPSAQPELITCKDCYWWTKQEDSLQGRCDLMGIYPTGGWYCGNAKR